MHDEVGANNNSDESESDMETSIDGKQLNSFESEAIKRIFEQTNEQTSESVLSRSFLST